jgi:O-antigen ligase
MPVVAGAAGVRREEQAGRRMMQELRESWAAFKIWIAGPAGEGRLDRCLRLAVTAVVLLFPALCLLVSRSDSYSLLILLLVGVIAWWRNGFRSNFSRRDWMFVAVFVGFFLAGVLAFELGHQTDYGFRLLGRYMRLMLVLPILAAFKRYRPPAAAVWAGLGLGSLVLGVDAVWERVSIAGFLQPDGDTNVAILFGDLATLTTFAFVAGYVYVDAALPRLGRRLVLICILAGLLACILSGARGAWIALPVLLVLFISCRHFLHPRTVLIGGISIVALFGVLYLMPQTHVRARLASGYEQLRINLSDYGAGADASSLPACMQQQQLLEAWAEMAKPQLAGQVEIRVTDDYVPAKRSAWSGCKGHGALLLTNLRSKLTWVQLAHSARYGAKSADLHLLAAGRAFISFGNARRLWFYTRPRKFVKVEMHSRADTDGHFTITLMNHSSLWLVPVETYPGEFRYALADTSVGQRLEMWAVAGRLFETAPLTGVGTGAYMASARKLVDAGEAPPETAEYDHPHNEFFDALSSRGLVGLVVLLLLLGVPGWLFARGLDSPDPARLGASLAGLMVSVGFAMFGLSETMLVHSITLGWYAIMTAVFLATSEGPPGPGA